MTEKAEYKVNRGQYSTINMELPDKFHIIQTASENGEDFLNDFISEVTDAMDADTKGMSEYMKTFTRDQYNNYIQRATKLREEWVAHCKEVIDCEMEALKDAG